MAKGDPEALELRLLDIDDLPGYSDEYGLVWRWTGSGGKQFVTFDQAQKHAYPVTRQQWEALMKHVGARIPKKLRDVGR